MNLFCPLRRIAQKAKTVDGLLPWIKWSAKRHFQINKQSLDSPQTDKNTLFHRWGLRWGGHTVLLFHPHSRQLSIIVSRRHGRSPVQARGYCKYCTVDKGRVVHMLYKPPQPVRQKYCKATLGWNYTKLKTRIRVKSPAKMGVLTSVSQCKDDFFFVVIIEIVLPSPSPSPPPKSEWSGWWSEFVRYLFF